MPESSQPHKMRCKRSGPKKASRKGTWEKGKTVRKWWAFCVRKRRSSFLFLQVNWTFEWASLIKVSPLRIFIKNLDFHNTISGRKFLQQIFESRSHLWSVAKPSVFLEWTRQPCDSRYSVHLIRLDKTLQAVKRLSVKLTMSFGQTFQPFVEWFYDNRHMLIPWIKQLESKFLMNRVFQGFLLKSLDLSNDPLKRLTLVG